MYPTTPSLDRIGWDRDWDWRTQEPQHPQWREILHYTTGEVPGHMYCVYGLSLNVCQHYESSWGQKSCWEMRDTVV